jgi:hypothetical protein
MQTTRTAEQQHGGRPARATPNQQGVKRRLLHGRVSTDQAPWVYELHHAADNYESCPNGEIELRPTSTFALQRRCQDYDLVTISSYDSQGRAVLDETV